MPATKSNNNNRWPKLRGRNRSLSRLERDLIGHPLIDEAVVVVGKRTGGADRVTAYLATSGRIDIEQLESRLSASNDVIPSDYVLASHLPFDQDGNLAVADLDHLPRFNLGLVKDLERQVGGLPGVTAARMRLEPTRPEAERVPLPASLLRASHSGSDGSAAASGGIAVDLAAQPPAISAGPTLELEPDFPATLTDALLRAADRRDGVGLRHIRSDGEVRDESYADLLMRASRVQNALQRAGVQPGSAVLLQLQWSFEFLGAFWGCVLGGFVPVPVTIAPTYRDPANATLRKLRNAWELLGRGPIIAGDDVYAPLQAVLGELDMTGAQVCRYNELATADPAPDRHAPKADDTGLMLLTSGSTGVPKCVMLSHRNVLCRSAAEASFARLSGDDISLNWMAMDHVAGVVYFHVRDVYLACLQIHADVEVVLQNPLTWLDWVDQYRVTLTFAPNFAFGLVNRHADAIAQQQWDLSCLRWIWNGGEAIVAKTARRFVSLLLEHGLPATAMRPAWGMSETSSAVTGSNRFTLELTADDDPLVEVGDPFPGFEMRIVDDEGTLLSETEIGNLEARGPSVTAGYFNNDAANAASFAPDGWFRTGDLGFIKNGRLTMSGRQKDEIVINGVNYLSHDIEAVVEDLEEVDTSYTAACAVRQPDIDTDLLAVFFAARAGEDGEEVAQTIRQRVTESIGIGPAYVVPLERHEVPKTAIGKIQRTLLANQFAEGKFASRAIASKAVAGGGLPQWFFRPVWRRRDAGDTQSEAGGVVVAGSPDTAEFAGSLAAELEMQNVAEGELHAETERVIVALDRAPANELEPEHSSGIATLERLLAIIKQLASFASTASNPASVEVVAVSAGLRSVFPEEEPDPDAAAAIAFLKSAAQEFAWLRFRAVDLDRGDVSHCAEMLRRELTHASRDADLAYRDRQRYVQGLDHVDITNLHEPSPMLKEGGCYLVTGGLGGIANELSAEMMARFGARIALLGRSKIGEGERRERLQRLQAMGECVYERADVADMQELKAAVQRAETSLGQRLDGVIHCAGVFEERPVGEHDGASLRRALAAKSAGTVNLHALAAADTESLFVGVSSVNGFFGGHSVGAYAAANAYLDAFLERRRAAGFKRSVSVAYSLWDELGMSRGYDRKELSRLRGYMPLDRDQGVTSFTVSLASDTSLSLVGLDINNGNVRRLTNEHSNPAVRAVMDLEMADASQNKVLSPPTLTDKSGRHIDCELRIVQTDADDALSSHEIKQMADAVAAVWKDVLGVAEIGFDENLFDLGGDSLRVAQIAGGIASLSDQAVSPRDIFRYPTVRSLAKFLVLPESQTGSSELAQSATRGEKRRSRRVRRQSRRT